LSILGVLRERWSALRKRDSEEDHRGLSKGETSALIQLAEALRDENSALVKLAGKIDSFSLLLQRTPEGQFKRRIKKEHHAMVFTIRKEVRKYCPSYRHLTGEGILAFNTDCASGQLEPGDRGKPPRPRRGRVCEECCFYLGEPEEHAPQTTASETYEANGVSPGTQELKTIYKEVAMKAQENSNDSGDLIKTERLALNEIERLAHPDSMVSQNKLGPAAGPFGGLLKLWCKRTAFALLMLVLPGGLIILGLRVFSWAVNCGTRLAVIPLMLPPLWEHVRNLPKLMEHFFRKIRAFTG
jgi:hypothetical protein